MNRERTNPSDKPAKVDHRKDDLKMIFYSLGKNLQV